MTVPEIPVIYGLNLDMLPDDLSFREGETPTPEKTRAMLDSMYQAGYSMHANMIEAELERMGIFFAQQWVDHTAQQNDHATQAEKHVAEARIVKNFVSDATWASVVDHLGHHSPEVQQAAMEILGYATLQADGFRELYERLRLLRRGEYAGGIHEAMPPTLIEPLRRFIQASETIKRAALEAAQEGINDPA